MKVTIEFYSDYAEDMRALDAVFAARREANITPAAVVPPPPAAPAPEVAAVPPAPPAPTPAAAVVPPAPVPFSPTTAAPTFDKDGMPWDGRIHSSSKAFLADGTWRQRRNTDPAVVAAVTAELRAAMAAPAPAAPVAPAASAPVAPAAPAPAVPAAPGAPAAPQPWPFEPVPVADVPPAPPVDVPMTFPMFMKAITAARTPPATVLAACTAVGVPNIPALMSRPDLIPQVAVTLGVAP